MIRAFINLPRYPAVSKTYSTDCRPPSTPAASSAARLWLDPSGMLGVLISRVALALLVPRPPGRLTMPPPAARIAPCC